ncbi:MAG: alpha-L-fucosidase 2, partial [Candidatus Hydrogenedentes bacterium]|nr:alpha-L-fucosidase 2 [Candidatus Hydrogenedentota bacterium]
EALKLIKDGIAEMQYFPQGLFFNCRGYPSDLYNLKLQVNLIGGPGRPQVKWRDFFQCGMETISICGTAMQEMMLQSNEGKIRIFPAVPSEWQDAPLAFKLLARGGFLVASERQKGVVEQAGIESRLGGDCRFQNPWPGQPATVTEWASGRVVETRLDAGDVIVFATVPGTEYAVRRQDGPATAAKTLYASEPNKEPKVLDGKRTLGLGKGFFVEHAER